jgi:hypothetical protein
MLSQRSIKKGNKMHSQIKTLLKSKGTTLTAALFLGVASQAEAFDIGGVKLGVGPKLGLNMNKADIGNVGSSSFGFGWTAGVESMLDLDFIAIELGLQYSARRFSFKNLGGAGTGDFAATLSQFEIPLLVYYKHALGETIALRGGLGAQFEIGIGSVKGDAGSASYSDAGISKNSSTLLFDIGGDYKIADLGTLTMDIRYGRGLKDRSQSSGLLFNDKFKTQYIELAAGFLF